MSQLANHVTLKSKDPEVGDGVTIFYYTDRSAGTVSRVHPSGKVAWFKGDRYTRTDDNGMSEVQTYRYEQNLLNPEICVTRRKNGEWMTTTGNKVVFGVRDAYYDFSF